MKKTWSYFRLTRPKAGSNSQLRKRDIEQVNPVLSPCPALPCPRRRGQGLTRGRCGSQVISVWPVRPVPTCLWRTKAVELELPSVLILLRKSHLPVQTWLSGFRLELSVGSQDWGLGVRHSQLERILDGMHLRHVWCSWLALAMFARGWHLADNPGGSSLGPGNMGGLRTWISVFHSPSLPPPQGE